MKKIFHKFLSRVITATLFSAGLLAPITSHAFLIDSTTMVGDTFTIEYLLTNGISDGNGNVNVTGQDISGNALFTLAEFSSDNDFITLTVKLSNISDNNGVQVGWQKVAFATSPTAIAVIFSDADDGEFISAQIGADPEVQNALGGTYLDIQSETGNGAPRLLLEQEMDDFSLKISFTDLTDSGTEFSPFSSKWQTNKGSYEFGGTPPTTPPVDPPKPPTVPEPSILALLGLSIVFTSLNIRRRKSI